MNQLSHDVALSTATLSAVEIYGEELMPNHSKLGLVSLGFGVSLKGVMLN